MPYDPVFFPFDRVTVAEQTCGHELVLYNAEGGVLLRFPRACEKYTCERCGVVKATRQWEALAHHLGERDTVHVACLSRDRRERKRTDKRLNRAGANAVTIRSYDGFVLVVADRPFDGRYEPHPEEFEAPEALEIVRIAVFNGPRRIQGRREWAMPNKRPSKSDETKWERLAFRTSRVNDATLKRARAIHQAGGGSWKSWEDTPPDLEPQAFRELFHLAQDQILAEHRASKKTT